MLVFFSVPFVLLVALLGVGFYLVVLLCFFGFYLLLVEFVFGMSVGIDGHLCFIFPKCLLFVVAGVFLPKFGGVVVLLVGALWFGLVAGGFSNLFCFLVAVLALVLQFGS